MLDPSYIPQLSEIAQGAGESAYPELWEGLVGAWLPLCGTTGGIVPDVSGLSNHGIVSGAVWNAQGLSFSGTNKIDCGQPRGIALVQGFTVVSSVIIGSVGTGCRIASKHNGASFGWTFGMDATGKLFVGVSSDGAGFISGSGSTAMVANETAVVAAQYLPGDQVVRMWLNVNQNGQFSAPGGVNNSSANLWLGSDGFNQPWSGIINSVYYFNGAINRGFLDTMVSDPLAPFRRRPRRNASAGSSMAALAAASE